MKRLGVCLAISASVCVAQPRTQLIIVGSAELFAPGIASTQYSDARLTISPDGRTALWFSRDRPGGKGGYDIWMSHRTERGWSAAIAVDFNSPRRDFDPAFSADGRTMYFSSDRAGGFGGDDIYRVAVRPNGFGATERLSAAVNSAGNEWAPMLSPDGERLLFSSDGRGGAGRFDLFSARRTAHGFANAEALPGAFNTPADEFDATWLADGATVVFTRAKDLRTDTVQLFVATLNEGRYDAGALLPESVNARDTDAYAPMLDWSDPSRLLFSSQRAGGRVGTDLYVVSYQLAR